MSARYAVLNEKIIVDRRKPHRNSELARTMRKHREMLVEKSDNPDFDREMLHLHAQTMVTSGAAISLLTFVVMGVALFLGKSIDIVMWALATATVYAGFSFVSKRIQEKPTSELAIKRTRRIFLAGHCLAGLCWTYLAYSGCSGCEPSDYKVFQAASLLFAIAGTAILAYAIRSALVIAFFLPVLAFVVAPGAPRVEVQVMLSIMLIAALPFFSFVASKMNTAALMFMSFSLEKDGLIAELETAKSLSDEARLRAEEANLAKSRFLASMSHELRTPLNAILGFSEVMANEVLGPMGNPTYKDYAADIHDSGNHLLGVINEILDLSRIEAGKREIREEALRIAEIVEDCCRLVDMRARSKGIHVTQEFGDNLPMLWADEKSLRQVTLNLLSNAIKFTPTGGEILVRVGWTRNGGQYVSVKDNGPGIPEDEIPVVLSAFGQGSIAIKSAEEGTGLGLPIVQALVAMHGGMFQLKSKLRQGTEAIVIFPEARVLHAPVLETEGPGEEAEIELRESA